MAEIYTRPSKTYADNFDSIFRSKDADDGDKPAPVIQKAIKGRIIREEPEEDYGSEKEPRA